jgi:uncharacterized protein
LGEAVLTVEVSKSRKWLRRLAQTFLGLLGFIVLVTAALLMFKPWLSEKAVVAPLVGGEKIERPDIVGNFYPAIGKSSGGVLVIGGSDGGISATADNIAKALSEAGFDAMAASYWGAPGQPLEMKELPLEALDASIDFLKKKSNGGQRVAIMGYSKGAEAALLLAARRSDLAGIVAGAPTNVSWQALDFIGAFVGGTSTFSFDGKALPYLPYSGVDFFDGPTVFEIHDISLRRAANHPSAAIEIEKSKAPVLLLCGRKDLIWPACDMAKSLVQRAGDNATKQPRLLSYPEAGHGVLGPPHRGVLREDPLVTKLTRTAEADAEAREDAWPQVIAFLRESFGTISAKYSRTSNSTGQLKTPRK